MPQYSNFWGTLSSERALLNRAAVVKLQKVLRDKQGERTLFPIPPPLFFALDERSSMGAS